ncbi:pilus assembly protein [Comamonas sp. NoAH]|uniref:pilus assembly protein n=1 Tax=Comamonas halotolerans TaxID=3041496 RepID=UPI0024E09F46|nr:PilC/PilY family type IV pilus protein [Comamonas sp. NoAH]
MRRLTVDQPRSRKTLLALAVGAALAPHGAHALDLAQSPPGTTDPYVAPNVIISIDDSGSMGFRLDAGNATNAINTTVPNADGSWDTRSRRMNVLKYALKQVFNDRDLLPDGKIRLGWQSMWNNGNSVSYYNNLSYWYGTGLNPGLGRTPGANNVGSGNKNSIKVLDNTHRTNFIEFVDYLLPQGGTPSHTMFQQADDYLRKKNGSNPVNGGPWATNPGGNDALSKEFLGCRRNYHIMMTDGRWNSTASGGNRESTSFYLPDGTYYTANGDQTKVFYDKYANTLADWAFYSWSNNLQPSIYSSTDSKKQISLSGEYRSAPNSEVIGGVPINKYWNPKYNPANWPHLVTYTIGFSEEAITWPGASSIIRPTETTPFGYDGSFPNLVNGSLSWPNTNDGENVRALDLWHAAINGRGRFYAVSKGEDLEKAFREIIGVIKTQAEPDRSSAAATGMSINDKPVGMFITSNNPKEAWRGDIWGSKIELSNENDPSKREVNTSSLWGGKSAASILDAKSPEDRTILTWSDNDSAPGKPFLWSNLSAAQKACLSIQADSTTPSDCETNNSLDARGEDRLNYIRGDRSQELSAEKGVFRNRQTRLGDIVNSNVWYTGAPVSNYSFKGYSKFTYDNKSRLPMIYVGANDGMLHGFSADDGSEKIAYIPRGVLPNLTRLTWPSFDDNHRYFVDGSPMTGDVDLGTGDKNSAQYTPEWHTMLVGTLGAGGKGYFVLNVTDPADFSNANAASLVVMDKTMHSDETINCVATPPKAGETTCANHDDADIGHIFAIPTTDDSNPLHANQIARLNNDRWAVVMGNGYNSKNGRPVLLIQYLDGGKELLRLPATSTVNNEENHQDNGLSAPRLVDINNDGRPDVVYAGDLHGNMWKFVIAAKNPDDWGVAFDREPLFTALGGTAGTPEKRTLVQSITAAPTVRANDRTKVTGTGNDKKILSVGGMMVAFGTGRNVTTSDPDNTDIQTLYSVLDNTRYTTTYDTSTKQSFLAVHPGDSSKNIPVPTPLGDGLDTKSNQSKLAQQKVGQHYEGEGTSENHDYWQIDKTSDGDALSVDWNKHSGWYLDLPETGERLLKPMSLYDGSNILAVYSQVPAKGSDKLNERESCESSAVDEERQYLTLINIMDGMRPSVQLMDRNGDGTFDLVADNGVSRMTIVKGAHRIINHATDSTDFGKGASFTLARMPEQSLRPSWRQLK